LAGQGSDYTLRVGKPLETKVVPWGMLNFGHKFDPSQSIFRCVPIRSQTQKACRRFWATNVDLKKTQRTNRLPNAAEAGMNSGFSPNIARRNPRATLSCGWHKPAR
jgi:hypothetical protein